MKNLTSHRPVRPAQAALLFAATIGTVGALLGGASSAQADATGALLTAKTISVKETFRTAHQSGDPLTLSCDVTVEIARPGSVKVVLLPPNSGGKTLFYVADGGPVDHQFNGFAGAHGQIDTLDTTPETRSHDMARQLAAVDTILNPDPQKGSDAPNTKSAVTTETLDGRAMILRTETRTDKGRNNTPLLFINKFWYDAKTGFPYRRSDYTTINGKTDQVTELDFSDWKLDTPIPAAEFAFVAPTGSEETPKLLAVGTSAPDFAVTTPGGKTVHLSDFKGKTVILDFWATWCGPCQESLPHLEKVYQQIKNKNVVVLAVCVWDSKPAYDKWIAANAGKKYHFPFAFDPAAQATEKSIAGLLYHATGIPAQFLIDPTGKVVGSTNGYGEGDHRLEDSLRQQGIALPAATVAAR